MKTHGIVSSYKAGCRCKECKAAGASANRNRKRLKALRISVEPMVENLPSSFRTTYARSIKSWEERGISVYIADKICCSYGLHPWVVYGDMWFWSGKRKELENV